MTGSHFILAPGAPRPSVSRLVSDPDHPDLLIRTHTPTPVAAPALSPAQVGTPNAARAVTGSDDLLAGAGEGAAG